LKKMEGKRILVFGFLQRVFLGFGMGLWVKISFGFLGGVSIVARKGMFFCFLIPMRKG